MIDNPESSDRESPPCIFKCGEPNDETMMAVELNVTRDAAFHAHQNHPESDHRGPTIAAERVAGVAHVDCYRAWYEQTYKTPFTMST